MDLRARSTQHLFVLLLITLVVGPHISYFGAGKLCRDFGDPDITVHLLCIDYFIEFMFAFAPISFFSVNLNYLEGCSLFTSDAYTKFDLYREKI